MRVWGAALATRALLLSIYEYFDSYTGLVDYLKSFATLLGPAELEKEGIENYSFSPDSIGKLSFEIGLDS